jgi:hypothetical protein
VLGVGDVEDQRNDLVAVGWRCGNQAIAVLLLAYTSEDEESSLGKSERESLTETFT